MPALGFELGQFRQGRWSCLSPTIGVVLLRDADSDEASIRDLARARRRRLARRDLRLQRQARDRRSNHVAFPARRGLGAVLTMLPSLQRLFIAVASREGRARRRAGPLDQDHAGGTMTERRRAAVDPSDRRRHGRPDHGPGPAVAAAGHRDLRRPFRAQGRRAGRQHGAGAEGARRAASPGLQHRRRHVRRVACRQPSAMRRRLAGRGAAARRPSRSASASGRRAQLPHGAPGTSPSRRSTASWRWCRRGRRQAISRCSPAHSSIRSCSIRSTCCSPRSANAASRSRWTRAGRRTVGTRRREHRLRHGSGAATTSCSTRSNGCRCPAATTIEDAAGWMTTAQSRERCWS